MTTLIRPEISKRKETWIPKHRYYELKHFCLQYPEWKKYIASESYLRSSSVISGNSGIQIEFVDSTSEIVSKLSNYISDCELIEQVCMEVDSKIWKYLLEAVTKEKSWNYLKYVRDIPCSRNHFYNCYRKFFYELDRRKG